MNKLNRFVSRHRWVPITVIAAAAIFCSCLLWDDVAFWDFVPAWVLLLLTAGLLGLSASGALLLKAAQPLDNACDPYPLLEETALQLTYVKGTGTRAELMLNRGAALIAAGQFAEAHRLLDALSPADLAPLPVNQAAYHINLADCALALGNFPRAQLLYELANKQAQNVKNKKQAPPLQDALRLLYINLLLAEGRGVEALPVATQMNATTQYMQVCRAYAYAQIARVAGDTSALQSNLEYVAACGNRLWIAEEARRALTSPPAEVPGEEKP